MSNIDNAKLYAEGKVAEALKQVVADAYMAGYDAGYQDGVDKVAKDSALEGVEYVDLGLPSGTLWASDYVKDGDEVLFLPYPKALKYNIPTEEQVDELQEFCEISRKSDGSNTAYIVLGPNGNAITFKGYGYMHLKDFEDSFDAYFWQVYESDNPKEIQVPDFYNEEGIYKATLFGGYGIPVRTVKAK